MAWWKNDGSHACRPGKVAVGDEVQLRNEHLLRRKKTNEIGIAIGGQARQDGQAESGLACTIVDTSRVGLKRNGCVPRMLGKPRAAAEMSEFLRPRDDVDVGEIAQSELQLMRGRI